MSIRVNRRELIVALGGALVLPSATGAQETERVRRIGVLMTGPADDAEGQSRLAGFLQSLQQLGWTVGRNLRIDYRWANDSTHRRQYAAELIALAPEVILASTSPSTAALQQASNTVPIVFASVTDPVGQGFVASLPHPGGNITGFALYEYGISTKWLELLKEIAPHLTRVAVLRDPTLPFTSGELGAMQGVAPSLRVDVSAVNVRDAGEIERGIATFARQPNGGLVALGSPVTLAHRDLIATLAARHRLPAIYTTRYFVTSGGLMSYGPDRVDLYRRAAGYVDRILKGENPADLPVEAPTKFELTINLKTAKALGLSVPPSLLAQANEVIE
ncbi:MAG TPA: ABC transporter substrate-binding protein [Pseudolabrys sp.]|nr:ABC transporter substrate-binding protein [Pseudolabrys sp.]